MHMINIYSWHLKRTDQGAYILHNISYKYMAHHINAVNQTLYKYVTRICNKQCRRRLSALIDLFTWRSDTRRPQRTFIIDIPKDIGA